jgi:hypothetical protein
MSSDPLTTLASLLAETKLEDVHVEGHTLRSLSTTLNDGGRQELLDLLKEAGVSKPPQRSKIANALSKAEREGRLQPSADEVPAEAPSPDVLTAAAIRNGGYADGRLVDHLRGALPPLQSSSQMPGEEKGATRGCFVPKPAACVRLFCLYGVADSCMSLKGWVDAAPAGWLEVRLVDLPGHGFRSHEDVCSRQSNSGA